LAFDIPTQTYDFTKWQHQREYSGHAFLKDMQHDLFWIDRKLEILSAPLAGGLLVISAVRGGMDDVVEDLLRSDAVLLDELRQRLIDRVAKRELLATEVEHEVPLPSANSIEGTLNAEMVQFQVKLAIAGLEAKKELALIGKKLVANDPDAERVNKEYLRKRTALREAAIKRLKEQGLPIDGVQKWGLPKGII
jgi:hypothetical protein